MYSQSRDWVPGLEQLLCRACFTWMHRWKHDRDVYGCKNCLYVIRGDQLNDFCTIQTNRAGNALDPLIGKLIDILNPDMPISKQRDLRPAVETQLRDLCRIMYNDTVAWAWSNQYKISMDYLCSSLADEGVKEDGD